jgi:hypothetical protein
MKKVDLVMDQQVDMEDQDIWVDMVRWVDIMVLLQCLMVVLLVALVLVLDLQCLVLVRQSLLHQLSQDMAFPS